MGRVRGPIVGGGATGVMVVVVGATVVVVVGSIVVVVVGATLVVVPMLTVRRPDGPAPDPMTAAVTTTARMTAHRQRRVIGTGQ